MGLQVSETERHLIDLLVADEAFYTNALTYRSILEERDRRESGDKTARPMRALSRALDRAVRERNALPLVRELGADVRIQGLAFQRVSRDALARRP